MSCILSGNPPSVGRNFASFSGKHCPPPPKAGVSENSRASLTRSWGRTGEGGSQPGWRAPRLCGSQELGDSGWGAVCNLARRTCHWRNPQLSSVSGEQCQQGHVLASCHSHTEVPCPGETAEVTPRVRLRWEPRGLGSMTTSSCSSVFFLRASSKRLARSRRDWLWKVSVSTWSCKDDKKPSSVHCRHGGLGSCEERATPPGPLFARSRVTG